MNNTSLNETFESFDKRVLHHSLRRFSVNRSTENDPGTFIGLINLPHNNEDHQHEFVNLATASLPFPSISPIVMAPISSQHRPSISNQRYYLVLKKKNITYSHTSILLQGYYNHNILLKVWLVKLSSSFYSLSDGLSPLPHIAGTSVWSHKMRNYYPNIDCGASWNIWNDTTWQIKTSHWNIWQVPLSGHHRPVQTSHKLNQENSWNIRCNYR